MEPGSSLSPRWVWGTQLGLYDRHFFTRGSYWQSFGQPCLSCSGFSETLSGFQQLPDPSTIGRETILGPFQGDIAFSLGSES